MLESLFNKVADLKVFLREIGKIFKNNISYSIAPVVASVV